MGDRGIVPVLQDVPIAVTAKEILAAQGQGRIRSGLLHDAEEAIALGQPLWQPVALYDWFDLDTIEGERVVLSSASQGGRQASLHIGPKANLLAGAERVLVSVATIGPELERRVHELQAAGEGLRSYLLDSAGVVALGNVGEAIRCLAEETAAQQGWGVSPSLSPGSLVGWPLVGQRELCALLPLDAIGVRLNAHCVLVPHKSVSGLIGLGPGYEASKVGSVCKYCSLQNTCWRRREDPS
jgi:hypothetical protein